MHSTVLSHLPFSLDASRPLMDKTPYTRLDAQAQLPSAIKGPHPRRGEGAGGPLCGWVAVLSLDPWEPFFSSGTCVSSAECFCGHLLLLPVTWQTHSHPQRPSRSFLVPCKAVLHVQPLADEVSSPASKPSCWTSCSSVLHTPRSPGSTNWG